MLPRLNEIALMTQLTSKFKTKKEFIKKMIGRVFHDDNSSETPQKKLPYLLQSSNVTKKRIFAIITSVIPTFKGKRGVIICNNDFELRKIADYLVELFPGLKMKLIEDIQPYWQNKVSRNELADYNILLCDLHQFVRLRWDFTGAIVNCGAVCFHDVIPSEWYYNELLAITMKLKMAPRPPQLHFSSWSNLPHIRAICPCKLLATLHLPEMRTDVSWYNLFNPLKDNAYFRYLEDTISILRTWEPATPQKKDGPEDEAGPKLLIVLDNVEDPSAFESIEPLRGEVEGIFLDDNPKRIEKADILVITDLILKSANSSTGSLDPLNTIAKYFAFLRPGGKVIFYSPYWTKRNDLLVSGLIPFRLTRSQKEQMVLFLLFHDSLLQKELFAMLGSSAKKSFIQITSEELQSILQSLERRKLIKKQCGRYTCSHIGKHIVRYRKFLKYEIWSYLSALIQRRGGTSPDDEAEESYLDLFLQKADLLAYEVRNCPHIINMAHLISNHFESRTENEDEEQLVAEGYEEGFGDAGDLYSLSIINPKFEEYNPYKDLPEDFSEGVPTTSEKGLAHKIKPRVKPPGRKYSKNRKSCEESEEDIIKEVKFLAKVKNEPVYWSTVIEILGLHPTTGFRMVQRIIEQERLTLVKPSSLEPKSLDPRTNEIQYRGRPKKYLIPPNFDLSSLDQHQCGRCRFFTRTNQCAIISELCKLGDYQRIPNTKIQEFLVHRKISTNLRIHPRMKACDYFELKNRDYELKSLKTRTDLNEITGDIEEFYTCHEKGCKGLMPLTPDFRTLKCPECHTKYTRVTRDEGSEVIKVNRDVSFSKKKAVMRICGVKGDEKPPPKKEELAQAYKTYLKKKIKRNDPRIPHKSAKLDYDPLLRNNLQQKYGTPGFYHPRIMAILVSCILATLELKTLEKIEDWIIDRHVFTQLEQLRKCYNATTIEKFRTAERVIANQYWKVCSKIFGWIGFHISSRKLMRYVREFLEQPFIGSLGYTPANTLINNIHKIRYEKLRKLLKKKGYGFECPGIAEHTNKKFGIVLDLSDLLKIADRFNLIKALIDGKVTNDDLYSIFGRHGQKIFVLKKRVLPQLRGLIESSDQKFIYFNKTQMKLGAAFEQFLDQMTLDLNSKAELGSVFTYIPNVKDYDHIKGILENCGIAIPCMV